MKNLLFAATAIIAVSLSSCKKDPKASFTASATSVDMGSVVTFTDGSTDAFNHIWDFGDGESEMSTLNPSHVYMTPGTYNVILQVTDKKGKVMSVSDAMAITVNDTATYVTPAAALSFTASSTSVLPGQVVSFTNSSTHAYGYKWDFGDGGTSTLMNPTYRYWEDGTYTVTLEATDAAGVKLYTTTTTVTVSLDVLDQRDSEQQAKSLAFIKAVMGNWSYYNEDFEYEEECNITDYDNDYELTVYFYDNNNAILTDEFGSYDGQWDYYHVVDDVIYANGYYWTVTFDGANMFWTRQVTYQNWCWNGNGYDPEILLVTRSFTKQ
ncbi:MAG: PKD domain-containing protein [Flavobacteriales bacterium]